MICGVHDVCHEGEGGGEIEHPVQGGFIQHSRDKKLRNNLHIKKACYSSAYADVKFGDREAQVVMHSNKCPSKKKNFRSDFILFLVNQFMIIS